MEGRSPAWADATPVHPVFGRTRDPANLADFVGSDFDPSLKDFVNAAQAARAFVHCLRG
jgi:hypothetical protein